MSLISQSIGVSFPVVVAGMIYDDDGGDWRLLSGWDDRIAILHDF